MTKQKKVNYEVSLVTHLDILGFGELIQTRTAGDISRIVRIFKEITSAGLFPGGKYIFQNGDFVSFSDLTIMRIGLRKRKPLTGAIFDHLQHLARAQATLIYDHQIFIRGGVTIGDATKSWGQLYGPAIVEAYRLEAKEAIFPRIVVAERVLEEQRTNADLWHNGLQADLDNLEALLRRDFSGGPKFLDYLRTLKSEVTGLVMKSFQKRHIDIIRERKGQYANQARIFDKYDWLERYHEDFVYGGPEKPNPKAYVK